MPKIRKQQPPTIITTLARQLSRILTDYLCRPELNLDRHSLAERVYIKLLLTLSQSKLYHSQLLFRDFGLEHAATQEAFTFNGRTLLVHSECKFYLETLLSKPLAIIAKHKSLPTNLHMLLLMLCRNHIHPVWRHTRIKRRQTTLGHLPEAFFRPCADRLKQLIQNTKQLGEVDKHYQQRYGKLYLIVGQNQAEIPGAMSLFNVLGALPLPLNPSLHERAPHWYLALIERILLALNEEYGLLRSCGLAPQEFLGKLSIGRLRSLKSLKDNAEVLITEQRLAHSDAYARAFKQLYAQQNDGAEGKKHKFAGYEDFDAFAGSEVGMRMLRIALISLTVEDESSAEFDPPAVLAANHPELQVQMASLLTRFPQSFNPVTAYFFNATIVLQLPIYGQDGVLVDSQFQTLLAKDKTYAQLTQEQAVERLIRKIKNIIAQQQTDDDDDQDDDFFDATYA